MACITVPAFAGLAMWSSVCTTGHLRLPTVMRHISVLEEAGLITTFKEGRTRTCALVPEAYEPARNWLDGQRAIWDARLDRLDGFVTKAMKERKT